MVRLHKSGWLGEWNFVEKNYFLSLFFLEFGLKGILHCSSQLRFLFSLFFPCESLFSIFAVPKGSHNSENREVHLTSNNTLALKSSFVKL